MAEAREQAGRSLLQVVGVGIACWAAAAVAWSVWTLIIRQGQDVTAFAVPFNAWPLWFAPAGAMMLLYGGWRACRRRIPPSVLLWSSLVYFLPAALLIGAWRLFRLVEPHVSQLSTHIAMLGGAALFVLAFSGWVMGWMDRDRPLRHVAASVISPPLIGVVLLTLGFAVTVFRSVEWRHRHDFELSVNRVTWAPGRLNIEATVDVFNGGTYQCWAWYRYRTALGESGVNGDIAWPEEARMPRRPGSHRVQLRWINLDDHAAAGSRKLELQVSGTLTDGQLTFKKFLVPLPDPPAS